MGIELRAEDTELLRIAVACASERLTLSFSRLDLLTGRERVPSFYAFAAHRAAGGRDLDVREFEDRARQSTRTRIGWPAPPDPADAIDDAEFDLATLAPLTKGSGQYLKSLPGRAVDSLRVRWMRWHKPWKAADGLFIEEIGSQALAPICSRRAPGRPRSCSNTRAAPTALRFAAFTACVPPIGPPPSSASTQPPVEPSITPSSSSSSASLAADNSLPVTPQNLPAALDCLDAVLQQIACRAESDLAPAIPQIWRSEIQAIRADLRGWLQQKALLEPDWKPEFFELSFGLDDPLGRDPRSRKEPVEISGGFRLEGSIDLVERHASGVVRVVDHKTGKIPDPKPEMLGAGEVLQPALYALAAEKILGEPVAFGRLYYSTIAQNYATIDVPLNEWTRRRAEQALHVIDDALRAGFLPAAPRKDGCKRCEYLPVCGPYEEERLREKSQPELKALKDLRTWH